MGSFYRRIDCGLMCSTSEGFGRTTVEYMSWGKPVIGRDSGATPEILETNLTGILCGRSTDSLAGAMLQLAAQENRLPEMRSAAKRIVRSRFSLEQVGAQFKELLNQLLYRTLDSRVSG
jgi:glycosyltransferase involved in cell wall biosynthesis